MGGLREEEEGWLSGVGQSIFLLPGHTRRPVRFLHQRPADVSLAGGRCSGGTCASDARFILPSVGSGQDASSGPWLAVYITVLWCFSHGLQSSQPVSRRGLLRPEARGQSLQQGDHRGSSSIPIPRGGQAWNSPAPPSTLPKPCAHGE